MGWDSRAQISMEYLGVVGISLLMIIPLTVVFIQQSENFRSDINAKHLETAGMELVDAAEEVFYLGPPTQKSINLYFPEHIQTVSVDPQGFFFEIQLGTTLFPASFDSSLPLNMSGTLTTHPGVHPIVVTATNTGIVISEDS